MGLDFTLKSNAKAVQAATEEAIEEALEAVGSQAEGYAIALVPVVTSNLKQSITHEVDMDEHAAIIGSDVEYAPYVEFGTGIFADNGQGRQTPWVYQDDKGKWHYTRGQKPSHFLKNAIEPHIDEFKNLIAAILSQLSEGE